MRGPASRLHIDIVELKGKLLAYSTSGESRDMALVPEDRLDLIGTN